MLIVWDIDGTLLDSYPHYESAARAHCAANNLKFPDPALLKRGFGHPQWFDYGWPGTHAQQNEIRRGFYERLHALDALPETPVRLFPGIPQTLARLTEAGHRHAIITSRPDAPLMHVLRREQMQDHFACILADESRKPLGLRSKPFPDQLNYVMQQLDAKPFETVMVGDTEMDVAMGRGAGTVAVGVQWGTHDNDVLRAAGAHFLPATQDELCAIIAELHAGHLPSDMSSITPPVYPQPQ
ncbi:MAG: HAD-IA family hydrolase [Alphaproteobacteria bacterium]|nr:HAD-IA family hydrolase [Alphaproteobacteria bacterium]